MTDVVLLELKLSYCSSDTILSFFALWYLNEVAVIRRSDYGIERIPGIYKARPPAFRFGPQPFTTVRHNPSSGGPWVEA